MKRIMFAVATALVLGALTLALPKLGSNVQANPVASPAAPQIGGKACTNVKFRFYNNLAADKAIIRIEKVSYYLEGVGNKTELVHTSDDCKYLQTCTTTGDSLGDADGRNIKNIQLHYKYLSTVRVGANWSDLVHTPNQPDVSSPKCGDNKTYGLGSDLFYIPAKQ